MSIRKMVWLGADNKFKLLLGAAEDCGDATPVDLTDVTAMRLELGDQYVLDVAKDAPEGYIDWWDAGLALGEVALRLGTWAEGEGTPEGEYVTRLTTFDGVNVNGVVWTSESGRELIIRVEL